MMQPRRSVRFVHDEANNIYTIPCISSNDHGAIWYNHHDYTEILARCQWEVKLMKIQSINGNTLEDGEDDLFTLRGLEQAISSSKRRVNRIHVRSILDEQDRVRSTNTCTSTATYTDMAACLALVAGRTSKHRQRMAHLVAVRDEQAVFSYLGKGNALSTDQYARNDSAATNAVTVAPDSAGENCWATNSSSMLQQNQQSSLPVVNVPNKQLRRDSRRRRLATSSRLPVLC